MKKNKSIMDELWEYRVYLDNPEKIVDSNVEVKKINWNKIKNKRNKKK